MSRFVRMLLKSHLVCTMTAALNESDKYHIISSDYYVQCTLYSIHNMHTNLVFKRPTTFWHSNFGTECLKFRRQRKLKRNLLIHMLLWQSQTQCHKGNHVNQVFLIFFSRDFIMGSKPMFQTDENIHLIVCLLKCLNQLYGFFILLSLSVDLISLIGWHNALLTTDESQWNGKWMDSISKTFITRNFLSLWCQLIRNRYNVKCFSEIFSTAILWRKNRFRIKWKEETKRDSYEKWLQHS